jgi:hypothetical protein
MLEGEAAFSAGFTVEPDPAEYPDAARTVDQIKELLDLHCVEYPKRPTKPVLIDAAEEAGLSSKVWDLIKRPYDDAVASGVQGLTAAQHRAVRHMAELADNHKDIGPQLRGGISEVSVICEDPRTGVLMRNRFDSLHPDWILDLKSMSNWRGKNVGSSVIKQITEFEYDLQRVYYERGRHALRDLVAAGEVYDWDPEEKKAVKVAPSPLLSAIAESEKWLWVWLFYQVRDDKAGKSPIMVPRWHAPSGTVFDAASDAIDLALEKYTKFVEIFGLKEPWYHSEELVELDDGDLINLQYKRDLR